MIRAYVHEDITGTSVDISIVMHPPEGSMDSRPLILRAPAGGQAGLEWEEIPPGRMIEEPTLRLGGEEARALLDALTVHFHGADDARALRRDYDHERQRVDTLIGHLGAISRALTAPDMPVPPSPAKLEPVRAGKGDGNGWGLG